MALYCFWPDGTHCEHHNLHQYLDFMTEDYILYDVHNDLSEDELPTYDELSREDWEIR